MESKCECKCKKGRSVRTALHEGLRAEIGHADGKEASPQEAAQGDRERDLKAGKRGENRAIVINAKNFWCTSQNDMTTLIQLVVSWSKRILSYKSRNELRNI